MDILTKLWPLLLVYLAVINLLSCALTVADKRRATRRAWRIPEATLLGAAFLGGSLGSLLGMLIFRHKTRKPKFYITVPLLLAVHLYVFFVVYGVQPLN